MAKKANAAIIHNADGCFRKRLYKVRDRKSCSKRVTTKTKRKEKRK